MQLTTQTDYDPMGQLIKQQAVNRASKQNIIQRDYGYDQYNNLSYLKDGNVETHYIYDELNRLKKTQGSIEEQFDFDPAGNILSITEQNQQQSKSVNIKGNRLILQGDKKFEYDERGNLVRETRGKGGQLITAYKYNLQNQLLGVNKEGQITEYKYDPLGRRIEKKDTFGSTRYLWAENQMVQETRNSIKKTYLYEPHSFKPVALVQGEQIYHYHLDHLGTPRELTNDEGQIVWKVRYKTYGNVALKEVDEIENNLRFQGQYFDEESGLHYNRHRYYNPSSGQFISQDPIGLLGGINNYQYAPNPTGWVDPLGLSCKEREQQQDLIPENYDILSDSHVGTHGFKIPDGDPDEFITVYRGVHSDHPDFPNAILGKSRPWGGHMDPLAHNLGDNQSEFTSWTTNRDVAERFAGSRPDSVILEQTVKREDLVWSPDNYFEDEVLRVGGTSGAKVHKI